MINIVDVGATGGLSSDNFQMLQAAVNAAALDDDPVVYVPPGVWRVELSTAPGRQSIVVPSKRITIAGEPNRSVLLLDWRDDPSAVDVIGLALSSGTDLLVTDLVIQGSGRLDLDPWGTSSPHSRALGIVGAVGDPTRMRLRNVTVSGLFTYGIDISCSTLTGVPVEVSIDDCALGATAVSVRALDASISSSVELIVKNTLFVRVDDPFAGIHLLLQPHIAVALSDCQFRHAVWGLMHAAADATGTHVIGLSPPRFSRLVRCDFDESIVTAVFTSRTGRSEIQRCVFHKTADTWDNWVVVCQHSTLISHCSFSGSGAITGYLPAPFGPEAPQPSPWPLVTIVKCQFNETTLQVHCRHPGSRWELLKCTWLEQVNSSVAVRVSSDVTALVDSDISVAGL